MVVRRGGSRLADCRKLLGGGRILDENSAHSWLPDVAPGPYGLSLRVPSGTFPIDYAPHAFRPHPGGLERGWEVASSSWRTVRLKPGPVPDGRSQLRFPTGMVLAREYP